MKRRSEGGDAASNVVYLSGTSVDICALGALYPPLNFSSVESESEALHVVVSNYDSNYE